MVSLILSALVVTCSVLMGLFISVPLAGCVLALTSLLVLLVIYRRNFQAVRLILLLLVCLALLGRSSQVRTPDAFDAGTFAGQRSFNVIVDSAPKKGKNSLQVISHRVVLEDNYAGEKWHGGVAITFPRYTDVNYGDRITIEGDLRPTYEIEDVGYQNYLINHQVYGTVFWPKVLTHDSGHGNPVVVTGIRIQNSANQILQELLPRDAASFIAGVVLGSDQELSEQFDDSLKLTGTTHIIVASGYNISILLGMVLISTKHQRRSIKTLTALTIILCYLVVSGLDPSIVRASVMAALVLLVAVLGRQRQAANLLLLAAIIMLLVHPTWILDTGFQLSFAATLGIIALQPAIARKLSMLPDWLSEVISTTVSAQILVLPIIAITFSTVSVVSLLSNMLIVWVIPIIMLLGVLMLVTTLIFQSLGVFIAFFTYPIFWYIKQVVYFTSQIPYASVPVNVTWVTGVAYYLALMLLCIKWSKSDVQRI